MTKKLSSFSTLILLMVLIAVLAIACNRDLVTQQSDPPEQIEGKLLIWHPFEGEMLKLFARGLNDFQQLHPGVDIISEYVPQNELSSQFIKQAKNALGASIIIDFARQIPEVVKAGYIQAIDEEKINLSTYFPPTLTQIRYRGNIYGVPLSSQVSLLCYNQAKIKQSSSTGETNFSQPPTSLEGLVERARKGYSVGIVSTFEDTFWGMGIFGARFFDGQGFVNPELEGWINWLNWLKQVQNEPNLFLIRNREMLQKAFNEERLTYYVCQSNEIGDLKNNLKGNLRVASLPAKPERRATPILYTRVMMLNKNASPDEKRLAIELAKFLTNPEQQLEGIVQSQSFIPTNQTIKINQQLLPIEAVLLKQAQTAVAIPIDYLEQIISVFEQGEILYQKTLAGDISSSQASIQLTQFIKAKMNPYYKAKGKA